MNKKTILDVDVNGKRVFCRVDFNVPMKDGVIIDDTRLKAALPTIEYLISEGAKVILASHLGRPKGKVVENLRMTPIAESLEKLLLRKVKKVDEAYGEEVTEVVNNMKNSDVVLLENVRFYPGEQQNDPELAKAFADLADLYVNDAFGTAHRDHASTAGIANYLPSVAGFLMQKELEVLGEAIENPARPFTAIIGGAKVKDKIGIIDNLLDNVDHLIIGGGLAWTFVKAQGYEIGNSLLEKDKIPLAKTFIEKARKNGVKLHLPIDAIVATELAADAEPVEVSIENIPANCLALDIGPRTGTLYREIINESKLVIWNGPMGVFEYDQFAEGTKTVAITLAENKSINSIIGGGDSAAAVEKFGLSSEMSHISTGGGASLEFMEGKQLPSVIALDDR